MRARRGSGQKHDRTRGAPRLEVPVRLRRLRERLATLGVDASGMSPEDFARRTEAHLAHFTWSNTARVIKGLIE